MKTPSATGPWVSSSRATKGQRSETSSDEMEWTDEGIVIGVRAHGEASAIVDVMTLDHGRHLGLVRGGASTRMRPILQAGNTIRVVWRARLDEHLGRYAAEAMQLRSASFLPLPHALYALNHLCALMRLLPERDPHPALYHSLEGVLEALAHPVSAARSVARFELQLLAELGFGLDLERCAATGSRDDLIYVSPKSGRAVSREAGAPWQDRLLGLPAFLANSEMTHVEAAEVASGFATTGFFLARHLFEPRGESLPASREQFLSAVLRLLSQEKVQA